jgi:hypothetical protein
MKIEFFMIATKFLKISLFSLILGALTLSLAPQAQATTYYLDAVAGQDSNSGTSTNQAWQTLDPVRALTLQPGDELLFKSGQSWDTGLTAGELTTNSGLHLTANGTSGQPIVVGKYGTGAAPELSNSYAALPYTRAITISGDYITIKDLVIKNAKEAGVYVNASSSNVRLDNLDISATAHGVVMAGTRTTLSNSRLHDTSMFINSNDGGDNDSGAVGVMIIGSQNQILHNTLERNLQASFDYGTDGSAIEFFADGTTATGNVIAYNIIKDNDTVTEVGGSSTPTFSNNTFRYNVMVNNSRLAVVHLNSGGFGANVTGLNFFNNTIYENVSEWQGVGATRPTSSLIWFASVPSSNTMSFTNNIVALAGLNQVSSHNTFNHDYNLYDLSAGTNLYGLAADELTGLAQFVNPTQGADLRLSVGSPAINAGDDLGLSPDFTGTSVPQGSAPDLGAYELETSPTPSPTPSCSVSTDINNDSLVNLVDYSLLAAKFFQTTNIVATDLNCDGRVNLIDYSLLARDFDLLP